MTREPRARQGGGGFVLRDLLFRRSTRRRRAVPYIRPMRYALAALVCATLAASPAVAERLPTFPKQTEYGDARRSLLALGWTPVTMPGADVCDQDDERCQGRPEMSWCSGTGRARCGFTWRRHDSLITVVTAGEGPVNVINVECRAGC